MAQMKVSDDIVYLAGYRKPNGQAKRGAYKVIAQQALRAREQGDGPEKIARRLKVSVPTVVRAIKFAKARGMKAHGVGGPATPPARKDLLQAVREGAGILVNSGAQPKEFLMRLQRSEVSLSSGADGYKISVGGVPRKISKNEYDAVLSAANLLGVTVYELREIKVD